MIASLGRGVTRRAKNLVYAAGFLFSILRETLSFFRKNQVGYRVLVMQILFTGVEALAVISVLSIALGAIIIIQGMSLFTQFGQSQLLYSILIAIITRELGPILTAFIIIARSGTAICTEIGNMVVSHEIEAYVSVGINPISYIVVPRFLGVTIAMVLLNLYFNIFGLVGSFLISELVRPIPADRYFASLLASLKTKDIAASLIKSVFFGMIISTVSTYFGFKVDRATTEIPQMVIKAVGVGIVLCILANAVITLIYYL